ncbi:TetR/AcrR family transcriptional regulator [Rhodococcus gannanensis]|uniref:TetR/AcrR family transcriptional regulator n=1 Tax=Rhodococcus gannanensis TaxID=1960308 RepID=A0ABW4P096_9NOCA
MPAVRVYGGVSPADRRADRRARLASAVVDIVGEQGWSAATVRHVAATAGVGARFFYESFADMTDLVITAYDELGAELLAGAVEAIAATATTGEPDRDLHAKARAAVGAIVDGVAENPRRARFLLTDAPVLAERKSAVLHMVAQELARQSSEAGAALDLRQAQLCATVVMAGAVELVRGWVDGTLDVGPDELTAIVASTLSTLTATMPDIVRRK